MTLTVTRNRINRTVPVKKKPKVLASVRKRQTVNYLFRGETARKKEEKSASLRENCHHDLGIETSLFSLIKNEFRGEISRRFVAKTRLLKRETRTN